MRIFFDHQVEGRFNAHPLHLYCSLFSTLGQRAEFKISNYFRLVNARTLMEGCAEPDWDILFLSADGPKPFSFSVRYNQTRTVHVARSTV